MEFFFTMTLPKRLRANNLSLIGVSLSINLNAIVSTANKQLKSFEKLEANLENIIRFDKLPSLSH